MIKPDNAFLSEETIGALFARVTDSIDGFPHPNWEKLHEAAETNLVEAQFEEFWTRIAGVWVGTMQDCMGETCDFRESPNFMLLCSDEGINGDRLIATAESYLSLIKERLGGMTSDVGYGRHVVFLFGDVEAYYTYVGEFFGEREEIVGSAGVMLNRGYMHIALAPNALAELEYTLMHELVHCSLAHLSLPRWLDEALAMLVEQSRSGLAQVHLDHETLDEHLNYWDEERIQQFWSGESFDLDEISQKLSYQLADILRRLIVSDFLKDPADFSAFVNHARWEDAGEASARQHLEIGLADVVGTFLGKGDWTPVERRP